MYPPPSTPRATPPRAFRNSGGADDFLRFFTTELIPYVDGNYRTRPFRIISAHSLSALFVIHTLLTQPHVFGGYIAISPSLWWDGKILLRRAEESLPGLRAAGRFFFFSIGGLESEMMSGNVQHLFRLFLEYAPAGLRWKLGRLENQSHGTQALRALDDGLAFVYVGWEVPLRTIGFGLDAVGIHFKGLRETYGYDIEPSADDLEIYGLTALELQEARERGGVLQRRREAPPKFGQRLRSARPGPISGGPVQAGQVEL